MTELIWEGIYDSDDRRVAPLRVSLPFQIVESVNESAQQRQHLLDLFNAGRDFDWRNRLIWGDKKDVLTSRLDKISDLNVFTNICDSNGSQESLYPESV